jgi:hypothetical protein
MKAENEIWQVMSRGEVYQADLPTLKQWVCDGIVQPSDVVRKGSLKWIEAQRAPALRRVFTGEEQPPFEPAIAPSSPSSQPQSALVESLSPSSVESLSHAPVVSSSLGAGFNSEPVATVGFDETLRLPSTQTTSHAPSQTSTQTSWGAQTHDDQGWSEPSWDSQPGLDASCHFHPVQAATVVCRACHATFCRACPNQMGVSTVLLCPLCGNFCDQLEGVQKHQKLYDFQSEGFRFSDFGTALAYPFKHLASLLGGALLYSLVQFGGLYGRLLAPALLFGCITLVINRVGRGNMGRDFLPDFSDFNFWDDVLVPLGLGIGVAIVTLGPVALLLVALFFGAFGGSAPKPLALTPQQTAQPRVITPDDMGALSKGGTVEQEKELAQKVEGSRPTSQMAQGMKASRESDSRVFGIVRQLLARPGLILLLALLCLGWAVLYHPMALLVAGWTENFKSVVNPLIGLDTMRHMGLNYFKAFLMYLVVQGFAFVVSFVISLVTAPFNMPLIGNIPGRFLDGIITFYTSLVIACVLGLALFKSADRLGIEID